MISSSLLPLFSLAKAFRYVGQTNQPYGKPGGAKDGGVGIKYSRQKDGKNNSHEGPDDEYDKCTQSNTSLI